MPEVNQNIRIALVVAMAESGVIGLDNKLPWHLPNDLKYFKAITMGKPIVMGRKTFDSIGRPLPGRPNIVVTRNKDYAADGVEVVHTTAQALVLARSLARKAGVDEVMIIGGAQLYSECLPFIERMYVTQINAEVEGDAFFPKVDWSHWQEQSREVFKAEGKNIYNYSFLIFCRKNNQQDQFDC